MSPTVERQGKGQVILKTNLDYQATYKQAKNHDAVTSISKTEKSLSQITLKDPRVSTVQISPNGTIQFWYSQKEGLTEIFQVLKDIIIPVRGEEIRLDIGFLSFPSRDSLEIYQGMKKAERLVHPVRRPRPGDLVLFLPPLPPRILTGLLLESSIYSFLLDVDEDRLTMFNQVQQTLDKSFKCLQEFLTPVIESRRFIELMVEQVEQTRVFWEKCREVVTFSPRISASTS